MTADPEVEFLTNPSGQLAARFSAPDSDRETQLTFSELHCLIGARVVAGKDVRFHENVLVRMRFIWIERGQRLQ